MDDLASDRSSLTSNPDLSRRSMLASTLATGFAAAVQPVMAQTVITTDAIGLEAGEIKIKAADGEFPAYRAMPASSGPASSGPASGGPFPVILVVQEIFGVHEHIKDVCRRLAKLGAMAIAPELYVRQGDVSKLTSIEDIQKTVVAKVPDAQVMSDLDAAVAYAKGSGKGDTARLGITGFCWGGRATWLYAAHNPSLKAGVAWYGRLIGNVSENTPKHPTDIAAGLKAPVLGLYGGADKGIPLETVDKMREACKAAGKTCEFVVFPDAGHAFHADYRPSYRAEAAHDGWTRMQAWFKAHGVL